MTDTYKEGDVIYIKTDDGYHVNKILKVDEQGTFHVLTYEPISRKPKEKDLKELTVSCYHAPIASLSDSEFLTNIPVKEEDLEGYLEYLKMTDFKKYVEETGQDMDEIIERATEEFQRGNDLAEDGEFEEALLHYTETIQLFPLFYEALDNRGLTYMDLKKLDLAILDFNDSLEINPDGIVAAFSLGECFYKLGKFQKALEQFERSVELESDNPLCTEWLEKTKERMKNGKSA